MKAESTKAKNKSVITLDLIELENTSTTWQEAVISSCMLLVKNHYVEQKYIQAVLKSVDELGPYIVIYPGFALPHANMEDSIWHTGVSFTRLLKPIYFPKRKDDPVNSLIAFCSDDSRSHIKILQKLAMIFRNEDLIDVLQKSRDKEVILNLITGNLEMEKT